MLLILLLLHLHLQPADINVSCPICPFAVTSPIAYLVHRFTHNPCNAIEGKRLFVLFRVRICIRSIIMNVAPRTKRIFARERQGK
uniref:Putative secreted protein n=1 Tax=Anopheles triannulatus TaxID=58253 RepID=A0A2M4B3I9_9DIPT